MSDTTDRAFVLLLHLLGSDLFFAMLRSPLQHPPSLIAFPQVPTGEEPLLTLDFIDYDGVFSVFQCLATRSMPFVVLTAFTLDEGWSPKTVISREAAFEPATWPIAVQQISPLTLVVSTPSMPRPRPCRVAVTTLQGELAFLRLDLWEKEFPATR